MSRKKRTFATELSQHCDGHYSLYGNDISRLSKKRPHRTFSQKGWEHYVFMPYSPWHKDKQEVHGIHAALRAQNGAREQYLLHGWQDMLQHRIPEHQCMR